MLKSGGYLFATVWSQEPDPPSGSGELEYFPLLKEMGSALPPPPTPAPGFEFAPSSFVRTKINSRRPPPSSGSVAPKLWLEINNRPALKAEFESLGEFANVTVIRLRSTSVISPKELASMCADNPCMLPASCDRTAVQDKLVQIFAKHTNGNVDAPLYLNTAANLVIAQKK